MLKTELIALVRRHKPPTPTYALDEMAKEKGHQVLRLPPYHCQYNAIELIWAQIKGKKGRQRTSPSAVITRGARGTAARGLRIRCEKSATPFANPRVLLA
ncbi:hypothetical protein EVAR_102320_1 [Eumeta japonica]|uniref:Tc1-like transposase DDE domain-containing protein n=1 Tax=Eumeta variegata TaxID=151549 RepID=A0A4C1SGS0_EUMVA|nr:hypothetical protein EVAR_102320_1 [Eumeta japonica]